MTVRVITAQTAIQSIRYDACYSHFIRLKYHGVEICRLHNRFPDGALHQSSIIITLHREAATSKYQLILPQP